MALRGFPCKLQVVFFFYFLFLSAFNILSLPFVFDNFVTMRLREVLSQLILFGDL